MEKDIDRLMKEGAEVFDIDRNGTNSDAHIGIRGYEISPGSANVVRYVKFFPDANPNVGDVNEREVASRREHEDHEKSRRRHSTTASLIT